MDVTCERCGTEYDFDDALVSERGTTVKCTNCGAPIDLEKSVACQFCQAPVSVVDSQGLTEALREVEAYVAKRTSFDAPAIARQLAEVRQLTEQSLGPSRPSPALPRTATDLVRTVLEQLFGTDDTLSDRGSQLGGFAEAGLRIEGAAGALEMFAGVERRVDAYPTERVARQWGLAGFRLISR